MATFDPSIFKIRSQEEFDLYKQLTVQTDALLATTLELWAPVWEALRVGVRERRLLATLNTAGYDSSGSVLILVENGKVWDAAKLCRTTLESSLRFIKLLSASDENDAFAEWFGPLDDAAWLRMHRKVEAYLAVLPEGPEFEGARATLESMLLSDEEAAEMSSRTPRKIRRQIEERWNATKILTELAEISVFEKHIVSDFHFFYLKWSASSHANPLAVASYHERSHRPEPHRTWADLSSAATSCKHVYHLSLLKLMTAYRSCGLDIRPIYESAVDNELDVTVSYIMERHYELEYGTSDMEAGS